ncbi:alpha/beta hydrolase [Pricia sp. S334]|uniref:Alpha/beta hydrolase n=1 Tax=Pricia mediterranea TaxID=3076079 RepID=A0ABU3L577_9FLAO|nr:alpha/beta hydrolase [Pricia sp. S334]MDT7828795.1 alpha/beta hydrolase [Pricia sp. S334]
MQVRLLLLTIIVLTAMPLMSQNIEHSELSLPKSNITLNYRQTGDGDNTIVLIHGLGSNSKAFRKNLSALAEKAVVVAPDLPGYGATELGSFVPGMANYAKVIAEFIELKKLENVTLVGHSMGGQIAMYLAAVQQPSWLTNLVLLAPAGLEQFTEDEKQWFHTTINDRLYLNMTDVQIEQNFNLNFFGNKLPEDARFMLRDRLELKEGAERYREYVSTIVKSIHAMLAEPAYDKIPDIQVPVLVVYGKNDMLIPNKILHPQLSLEKILKKLKEDYPNIKTEQLDRAGHFVLWDRNDAVNDFILEEIEK